MEIPTSKSEIPTTAPHIIRLNRVWELRCLAEPLASASAMDEMLADTSVDLRVDLPWTAEPPWLEEGRSVLATRRFNRPSNLSVGQTVLLSVAAPATVVTLYFNGEAFELGAAPASEGRGSRRASVELGDRPAPQELRPPSSAQGASLLAIGAHIRDNNRLHLMGPPAAFSQIDVRLQIYDAPDDGRR